jgi:hypothetical protein
MAGWMIRILGSRLARAADLVATKTFCRYAGSIAAISQIRHRTVVAGISLCIEQQLPVLGPLAIDVLLPGLPRTRARKHTTSERMVSD